MISFNDQWSLSVTNDLSLPSLAGVVHTVWNADEEVPLVLSLTCNPPGPLGESFFLTQASPTVTHAHADVTHLAARAVWVPNWVPMGL